MTRRRDASPEPHWGCSMSTKMYGLIPRKHGMGRDEFHDYYRHPHGTKGRNMTTMHGYVQNPQIAPNCLGPAKATIDHRGAPGHAHTASRRTNREQPHQGKY